MKTKTANDVKTTKQKMTATMKMAIWAKQNGYDYVYSVVGSSYYTKYFHFVSVDDIIQAGIWVPACYVQFKSGAHGRKGVTWKNRPSGKSIQRIDAMYMSNNVDKLSGK